jgi:hypothetical protein
LYTLRPLGKEQGSLSHHAKLGDNRKVYYYWCKIGTI